jgi:chromosome segregation protein
MKLLESQADFKERERQRLEVDTERAGEEIGTLTEAMGLLQTEIVNRGAELETLEADVAEQGLRLEARREIADSLRNDLEICRHDLEDARAESAEHSRQAASCDSRVASGQRRQEELEERLEQLTEDTERRREEATALGPRRGELARMVEEKKAGLDETRRRKERLEAHLESLRERAQDSEVRLETARTQLHRCKSRLSSLEEIQNRYEGFRRGTKAVMERYNGQSREKGIRGLVADILRSPVEYEPAVEAVLGERLGNVLVDSQEVGMDAVTFLKEGRRGRSSFIPVETARKAVSSKSGGQASVMGLAAGGAGSSGVSGVRGELTQLVDVSEGYEEVADYLLGGVVVVEDLERAVDVWRRTGGEQALVTLEGDVVDRAGAITGGSAHEQGGGILGQKREIRELRAMAEELERVQHQALARHLAIKSEMAATGRELDLVTATLHSADKELYGCQRDLDTVTERADDLDRRLAELRSERLRVATALREEKEEQEDARRRAREHLEKLQFLEERTRVLGQRVGELAHLSEDATSAVTELRVGVAQGGERLGSIRAQLDRAKSQKENAELRVSELQRSIRENTERCEVLSQEVEKAREEAGELSSEAAQLDERLQLARRRCEEHREAVSRMEIRLRELRSALNEIGSERSSTEMALQRLEMETAHLHEEVTKNHRVGLGDIFSEYHLDPVWGEDQQARLDDLERLLERMRAYYNPTARREFEELSERHEFLTSQRADLEEALERLSKAIHKINRTSRKRFKETFDAVNERFQAVFPRLFNGGKASLVLTESDDVLEAGVEIAAQPPGKKLQSVALLSGGEKALTAVSLIFAIFLHRPSPFCILDEVDAPLDEANVDRYNSLVREIGLYTQFILVTHNKRTMEMVDALYGVTMDEPGVSRIVQVNLKEAARLAA